MVQIRDCSKTMVRRTFVPLFGLEQSIHEFCHGCCHLVNRTAVKQLYMYYYIFLVHFHCGCTNPVTKTQQCFSFVPGLNTVARTNMVLILNKTSNREEKCSPESPKYRTASGEKLLSTRMSQEWAQINLEVPGAAISWMDATEKGSGSPTAHFVCAEDLLFFLLWPLSQEDLHYSRNTRTFRAQLKEDTAQRRTMSDEAFLADVGYKKRSWCGETSLTKGVCQKHGETGFPCGNDCARFRKRKPNSPKLSKHTAAWDTVGCWGRWK